MTTVQIPEVQVVGGERVLTPEALHFVATLQREFGARRDELVELRRARRDEVSTSGKLDFLAQTADIRNADWQVAPCPEDLQDRRVEMTGPTDPKMTVNALNSGARVWLADMEDASTPHWVSVVTSQVSLYDAIRRQIAFTNEAGKHYTLRTDQRLATIVMRPRGWHYDDQFFRVDGAPAVGGLVDFGLYFFHNAKELLARGSGPYFYLPKMESHLEARLWAEIFAFSEEYVGIDRGTVRATVLIETITAAFEMDEILYELRDYASGLNAGRWDYLFSIIKNFRDAGESFVLPDRNVVGMTSPFMRSYAQLLVKTCHKRGAHAIGGMSAFIPSRRDPEVNKVALAKVQEDKEREATDGFDGSWVAHPDLVPVCQGVFDKVLGDAPNQVSRQRDDVHVEAADLLDVAATPGEITEAGVRNNVSVAIQYLASWLGGGGAVAINNLMEDAATAEICRSQIWQWVRNNSSLADGRKVTADFVRGLVDEELIAIRANAGDGDSSTRNVDRAQALFVEVALADDYAEFLTGPAYAAVVAEARQE
jgi:malate synthase